MDETSMGVPGAVIVATREGSRIFLIEVQALVVDSGYGMAKRTFLGVDPNRANLMIAAMEKIAGVRLSTKDVILNIVGGFRASEPAVDLGIVYAILSSTYDIALPKGFAVYGEVGLTGEVRGAPQSGLRLQELIKMGFSGCILPQKDEESLPQDAHFKHWSVASLKDAITLFSKFK
jgi:DNA repair protein RadA/Sms